jgi:monofunctional biosynthetic peptidoglycan transglycosylase
MVRVAEARRAKARVTRRSWRVWFKAIVVVVFCTVLFYHGIILFQVFRYKSKNPEVTAMMRQKMSEATARGEDPKREQMWIPYERISSNLIRAVLAGEDSRFFDHSGFDWEEIRKAIEKDWEEKRFHRGASTISQQLAKNLFLSTAKTPVRKLHEALITWEMENVLSKRRILELYLNVIEWGNGIYGAEAASRHYFNIPASALNMEQAAFLSAIIPNPNGAYHPTKHRRRVDRRRNLILRLMRHVVVPKDLD